MLLNKVSILMKRGALECEKISIPILGKYDLTIAQFKILKYLYSVPPASARLIDLESFFSMTHPTVIGIVQNLEKKGLVSRIADQKHPRIRYLLLTDKAKELQSELMEVGDRIEVNLTQRLSESERMQLIQLLQKMQGLETIEP